MTVPTLLIEQDPRNDMRFRITISEAIVGLTNIEGGSAMIHHMERVVHQMKRGVAQAAWNKLICEPPLVWVFEHGGRKIARSTCFRPTGRRTNHYRAGISITFKDRDKAMLFKLTWLNRPAEPLAFAA